MVEHCIDGVAFATREACDFAFLQEYGKVFAAFAQNDSGNISFGVEGNGRKLFLKVAGVGTLHSCISKAEAVGLLQQATTLYEVLRHPHLIQLVSHRAVGPLAVAAFAWAEGECLYDHWNFDRYAADATLLSPRQRFDALLVPEKLAAVHVLLDFLATVEARGYVAVDFYDGSILYDFAVHRTTVCDIDLFRKAPTYNDLGEGYFGSVRFKAPEEYERGATMDSVTNVFCMGAMLQHFFGNYTPEALADMRTKRAFAPCTAEGWELRRELYDVVRKATQPDRAQRYPSVQALQEAWHEAI